MVAPGDPAKRLPSGFGALDVRVEVDEVLAVDTRTSVGGKV
jgi:hypothetical protein